MNVLFNATAHDQTDQVARYRALGWDVEAMPRLRRCAPDPGALAAEADRVTASIPDGACVLVGGLGWLCDAVALRLLPRGCRLFTALTTRTNDAAGHFIFTGPTAVVETPLSAWWHRHQRQALEDPSCPAS